MKDSDFLSCPGVQHIQNFPFFVSRQCFLAALIVLIVKDVFTASGKSKLFSMDIQYGQR